MLEGRRVLVTAAASGIGATVAARIAEAGARVYVCDSDEAVLRAYLRDHPGIGGGVADVAAPGDVERLVAEALDRLGGLDVLVNNAGVAGPAAPVEEMELDGLAPDAGRQPHRRLPVRPRRAVPAIKRRAAARSS